MSDGFFSQHWALFVFIPAAIFVWLEWSRRKRPSWVIIPRLVWIALVCVLVADWSFIRSQEMSQLGRLLVFVDRSDSVALVPERVERAKTFLKELEEWAVAQKQNIQIYSFGNDLRSESYEISSWGSSQSRVESFADSLKESQASALIIGDGIYSSTQKSNIPVYTLQLGEKEERDIWIEELQPVFTAFLKNRVMIPVRIGQQGFTGKKIRVRLLRGKQELDSREIELEESEQLVEFGWFPERMGEQIFEAEVEPVSGELSSRNNRASFRVRTVRDKIRILHIGGKPSLDLRSWRLFLTRQPDADLVSFYILRSIQDDPEARNNELSLIPFPYEDLFTTELPKFDIVILQNFNFSLYFQPFYLSNLANWVLEGGALLVLGGDQSVHEYRETPLTPLFPFQYVGTGKLEEKAVKAKVVSSHPLVRGLNWAFERPEWSARHQLGSDANSTNLVEYTDGIPFVSIRQAGRGRVMVINSDETWRLQMQPLGEFAPFGSFARRALQYLTFDPEMEPQRVMSGKWEVGRTVQLKLQPTEPSDWEVDSSTMNERFRKTQVATLEFTVPAAGVYEVKNSELEAPLYFETEERPWAGEWKRLISNDSWLRDLSDRTQGKFFRYEDRKKIFDQNMSGKQVIAADLQPWMRSDSPWVWTSLLAILFLIFVDFYLRKRFQWDS